MPDVTEFIELDPDEMHLVPAGANGFPFLLAKAVGEAIDEETPVVKACALTECEVCAYAATKAKLDTDARHSLSDSDFAYIDSKGGRHLPIHDAAHVRNALARFNQTHFESDEAKAGAHRKIVARAKELGIEVTAEKEVSTEESLSQTHEVDHGPGPAGSPEAGDGGEARGVSFPHGPAADGQGDTAPDKDLQRGEAGSQTAGAQTNKAEEADAAAKAPFVAMDNSATTTGGAADSDPGNPAWEHKDAALADCASHLLLRANELITMLGDRERAEKGTPLLTQETEGAIRRSTQTLVGLLTHSPTVSKEIEMTEDELATKLAESETRITETVTKSVLDAIHQDRKARKEEKAAKAAKEAEEAAKSEGAATPTAEGADASKAAEDEGAPTVESLKKQLEDTQELVAKMATEDGRHAVLNGAGLAAVLRGPDRETVLKTFDDAVEEAEKSGDADRVRTARFQRTAAKMVAQENGRERGDLPRSSRWGPQTTELFKRTGTLTEDAQLQGV